MIPSASVAFLASLLAGAPCAGAARTTAAVLDFEAVNTSAGDAAVVASFVRSALVRTRLFSVVERRRMEKVLAEQAFQQTGCTTSECAVRLGKLLNAKKVIAGSLSVLGKERHLNIRLVDVETGEIENDETSAAFANKEAPAVAEALVRRLLGLDPAVPPAAPAAGAVSESAEQSRTGRVERPPAAEMTGRDGAPMVLIPTGEFTMGSDEYGTATDERPPHRVSLSAFYLDKYEVTFDLYDRFCEATGRTKPSDNGWGRGSRPVINVSWDDATAYAAHYGKRLPTEAEWEYACRAGGTGRWCFGSDERQLGEYAWYNANSGSQTHPVGEKRANAWGLYDMHGNVWEWCADWYANHYAASPVQDPTGAVSGQYRVLRGGSWNYDASWCRSAYRFGDDTGNRYFSYAGGFRCASSPAVR